MAGLRRAKFCVKLFSRLQPQSPLCIASKRFAVTGNQTVDRVLNKATSGKIEGWLAGYERVVGLTEVREAQSKVIQAEELFSLSQTERRTKQADLLSIQSNLRVLCSELEKVHRGEERYLTLLTQEHNLLREEHVIQEQVSLSEEEERTKFALLSSAVRGSHEKERSRTERTKYWSIIGSVIGAIIGILGTSINNYLRMREIRGIVTDSSAEGVEVRGLVTDLADTMKNQHNKMSHFIGDLNSLLGSSSPSNAAGAASKVDRFADQQGSNESELRIREILDLVKKQESVVENEIKSIKDILAVSHAEDDKGNVVYVGPQVEGLLQSTENNLEWKIKINALWTAAFIYGAFALTLPVLYHIFSGGGGGGG